MNEFITISPYEMEGNPFRMIDKQWMLITAGNGQSANTMTASWGGLGALWNMPVSFAFIRPTRYTYEFTEREDTYSLCFFDESYRPALNLCGTVSGRDRDKIAEAGLTLVAPEAVSVPAIRECPLTLECRVLYSHPQDASRLPEDIRRQFYSVETGEHTAYYAQIVAAYIIED